MEERKEVKTFQVDYKCPNCPTGYLRPTGICFDSFPPRYEHKCNNLDCDYKDMVWDKTYPYIDYSQLTVEHIGDAIVVMGPEYRAELNQAMIDKVKQEAEKPDWISVKDKMPPFTEESEVRGGEKTTDMVEVMYNDGSEGEGVFRDNPNRSSWMTRKGKEGFLANYAWSGLQVEFWRPRK